MKILTASDIHSDNKVVYNLVKKAKKNKVDLVLLGGDIIETWSDFETKNIIAPFKQAGIEVLMVHGNHDSLIDIDVLSKEYGKGIYNLHGTYKEFDDVVIFGIGGVEGNPFSFSDEELSQKLKKDFAKFKNKKKILLTHEPPKNTKLDNVGWSNVGSKSLRNFIENYEPELVICGHIHETFGQWDYLKNSKILNAGRKGKIIYL